MTTAIASKWASVEEAVQTAKGIAWDGCHKIYVLMDEEQVALQRSYGYGEDDSELVVNGTSSLYNRLLRLWYRSSCGLRFISSVRSPLPGEDENDGYTHLIPQGVEEEEE